MLLLGEDEKENQRMCGFEGKRTFGEFGCEGNACRLRVFYIYRVLPCCDYALAPFPFFSRNQAKLTDKPHASGLAARKF